MGRRLGVYRWAAIATTLLVAVFAFSGSAFAADNSACLTCHSAAMGSAPAMVMSVPDVDRDTACKSCHIPGLVGSHPYHQVGANCGAACHPGWGDSLLTSTPNYTDPVSGASFASASSKETSASVLHILHSVSRWPAGIDASFSACASCHTAAACTSCHTGAVSAVHTNHSATGNATYPAYPSWTGAVGHGVTGVDQTQHTAATETNMCASAGCHDLEGTRTHSSRTVDDYNYAIGVNPDDPTNSSSAITYIGTWRYRTGSLYSGARMSYNNVAGSQLNATFTGRRVEVVSDKDPYRGKADIYLDNVKVATIDGYSSSTVYQAVLWSSETLAGSGPHTISVRPLNLKGNTSARATYVVVDGFRVYSDVPDSIAPACTSCHADKASGHGTSFSHEASLTVGTYGGYACTDCHSMAMLTEHARTSSKTSATSPVCNACHVTYAPYTLNAYDFTCGGTATTLDGAPQPCHNNAGQQRHDFADVTMIDANHTASDSNSAYCRSCHGSRLDLIHTEGSARTYNTELSGNAYAVSCLTCHGTDKFPTTADCTSSLCHGGSGVHSWDTHPVPATRHAASGADVGVLRTGGKTCATCHALQIEAEHLGKTSTVKDPSGGAVVCADCHMASYYPTAWNDAKPTSNTCVACHLVSGGAPGATTAGEPHEATDYNAKHDFSTYGTNATTCGGPNCHADMNMADVLHAASKPGAGDCTSCHTPAIAASGVPTTRACATCHTSTHNMGLHSSASTQCTVCHTDKTDISTGHASCATCHANATLTASGTRYLSGTFTSACTSCHNATVLGTHAYDPADPNHYTPALTNHTATGMDTDNVSGKTCDACHATTLKAEHVVVKAQGTGASADGSVNCVECHTDTTLGSATVVAGNWATKKCSECHTVLHDAMSTDHNLAGNASCAGADCHANTDNLATLHLNAVDLSSRTSCNVCHTNGADTNLSGITACSDCHPAHDFSIHSVTTDSGNCLRCHEKADNTPATDIRDVHPTCGTCHNPGAVPGGLLGKTSDCVSCHNASVLPDPHPASLGSYSPYDPNHYAGTETTHTASSQTGTQGGFACTQCHLMEMKPEHFKTSSAFPSVPGTYADKCVDCHEVKVDVITWNSTCDVCHAPVSRHSDMTTKHDVTGNSCTGTGCHSTDVSVIHAESIPTNSLHPSCVTCHSTNTAVPTVLDCGAVGCHAGMTAHTHTLDVANSNYNNTTNSGCTNSGAGCHGADTQGIYDVYHPNNGCVSGACHAAANHNDTQFNNPNTCQNCHGGGATLYDGAPDTVALTDVYPNGHYNETTHTAGSMSATVSSGGSASATCANCHNNVSAGIDGLYAQHQGLAASQVASSAMSPSMTCAECHDYSLGISAIVTTKWPTKTCNACHDGNAGMAQLQHGTTAPVVNATSPQSCGATGTNCHNTYDVHAIHKNAAGGCSLSGCHDYTKQGVKPTSKSCGSGGGTCHTTYNESTHYNATNHTSTIQGTQTYSLNGQSVTCQSCHGMELSPEHSLATSAMSGTGSVCLKCHNNTGSTTAITGKWSGELCSACHGVGAIPSAHTNVSAHTVTNTGCGSTGAGCHPTSDLSKAGADKTVNIHNDCLTCHDPAGAASWAYGVAGNLKYNPSAKTCGQATGCHTSTYYSTSTGYHDIAQAGEVNGNDAKHTASGMTALVGSYSYNNACSNCHSTTLKTAHATSSLGAVSCTSGGTGNVGCHNSTALPNSPTQVKASWTNKVCSDCHTTSHTTFTTATHTATAGTGCTLNSGCHGSTGGQSLDIRVIHDRVTSGCTASGGDSLSGSNPGCHSMDTAKPATTLGCGLTSSAGTKCHVNHTNTNHGVSSGGKPCYGCHSIYQGSMEDGTGTKTGVNRALSVHHVLGGALGDGDIAPNTGTFSTSTTDVYCTSCHSDHNYFNANKGANLRSSITNNSGASTSNTDYTTTSTYGICVTCHATSLAKQNMGTDQLNVGAANTPVIAGADFATSAHQYTVASAFGTSAFNANCSKCHSDEQTKQYATSTYKFGTHFSASAGILQALGAFTGNPPQEEACYKCHNATAAPYGETLSATAKGVQAEFAKASTHDLSKVTCVNCHNVHEASATSPVADPDNTYNAASITTSATVNTYCLKCHDGTTPTQTVNGTTLVPYTVTAASTANISANYTSDGHGAYIDCRDCHEQHGSTLVHLLGTTVDGQTVSSYSDTADQRYCLACHRSGTTTGAFNISQYYPTSVGGTAAAGMTRSGHRTVTAGTLPAGSAMPCRACHNPHGGAGTGYMLVVRTQVTAGVDTLIGDASGELHMTDAEQTPTNSAYVRQFCFSCHTTSDTSKGWNGSAMAAVASGCQVMGISRTGGVLKLPVLPNGVKGHAEADTYSCYLCHGDDFSESNSVNAHNPTGGESTGGIPCYICHTVYQDRMEDGLGTALGLNRTMSYHHVLGSATKEGDTTTYPTLAADGTTNVYCLSCHVDHDKFSPFVNAANQRSKNLRSAYDNAAATAASTDYSATGGGVCLGCHTSQLTRDNTNQKPESSSSYTPPIASADYNTSAHQYTANSTFTDATTFTANCAKCHDSEIDGGGMERGSGVQGFQTSANKFSVHYSAARRILGALGVTVTDPPAEEDVCFACHSLSSDGLKATANRDWYNAANMDAASQNIYDLLAGTPATSQTSANQLYFRPTADGSPSEPMPNAHQTGDTFAGGTWIGRLMAPNTATNTYETESQATNRTGTVYWRMVTFTSPPVASATSVGAGTWTITLNARSTNTNQNAYIRYMIYKWNSADTLGTTIVAKGSFATRIGTTAAPGTQYSIPLSGSAVSLAAGDKISVCLELDTRATSTTTYTGYFYWGSGADGGLLMPTAIPFTWASPATTPAGGHFVQNYSGIHRTSPSDETRTYISANKHVECTDCHGVHQAGTTEHTQNGNAVSAALKGASGATPTFSGTNWTAPTAYASATAATKEYEICFKCHSGYNTNVTTWGGTGAASWTDQGLEFSTSNQSYHPVVAALPATDPGTNGSSRLQAGDMRPAFTGPDGATYGGWVNGSVMYCSDCHAEGNAGSLGPHGSAVKWMLKGPNKAWPYTTAAANGTASTTGWRTYGAMDTNLDNANGDGLFCRNCHVLQGQEHTRNDHYIPCVGCHIRVPHGGKVSRFINATGASSGIGNLPARYSATGDGRTAGYTMRGINKAANSTSYSQTNSCAGGEGGCSSHNASTSESW